MGLSASPEKCCLVLRFTSNVYFLSHLQRIDIFTTLWLFVNVMQRLNAIYLTVLVTFGLSVIRKHSSEKIQYFCIKNSKCFWSSSLCTRYATLSMINQIVPFSNWTMTQLTDMHDAFSTVRWIQFLRLLKISLSIYFFFMKTSFETRLNISTSCDALGQTKTKSW